MLNLIMANKMSYNTGALIRDGHHRPDALILLNITLPGIELVNSK